MTIGTGSTAGAGRTALVVGATGIAGSALVDTLAGEGWSVLALSRNPGAERSGVRWLSSDLTSAASLATVLGPENPSHVFFTAWSRRDTEEENITVNAGMVRDLLAALRGKDVARVALMTGLKHYLFANPGRIPPGTSFLETLIHDFDTLNWLNPGALPVRVRAVSDALVAPEAKAGGLLDTAVVTVTYINGAIAVAEANFNAPYTAAGTNSDTVRLNVDLFHDAYTNELAHFVLAVKARRDGLQAPGAHAPEGTDARNALAVALAAFLLPGRGRRNGLRRTAPG